MQIIVTIGNTSTEFSASTREKINESLSSFYDTYNVRSSRSNQEQPKNYSVSLNGVTVIDEVKTMNADVIAQDPEFTERCLALEKVEGLNEVQKEVLRLEAWDKACNDDFEMFGSISQTIFEKITKNKKT